MLVLILLIGVALVSAPLLVRWRADARRNFCQYRQFKTGQAILAFENLAERFPGYREPQAIDRDGKPRAISWVFPLLPLLDYDKRKPNPAPWEHLFRKYGREGPAATRGQAPKVRISTLWCPEGRSEQTARTFWVVNAGMPDAPPPTELAADWAANGVFFDQLRVPRVTLRAEAIEKADGLNQTLLLSENLDAGLWSDSAEPQVAFLWTTDAGGPPIHAINERRGKGDGSVAFARPSSWHVGGVNAVFCSGRVQFVAEKITPVVWAQMMSSDDRGTQQPGSLQPLKPPYRRDTIAPPKAAN